MLLWTRFASMSHGVAMSNNRADSFDYERSALNALESAQALRTSLAEVYNTKPLDGALTGALKAGIHYSLKTAQTYATLATVAAQREALLARVAR